MRQKKLAEYWANGAQAGTASNMYIKNGTIYSYGSHFPIARWWEGHVLMTNKTYSSSTARHVSHVRNAIGSSPIIYMSNVPKNMGNLVYDHVDNIKDYFASINGTLPSLLSAKKPQLYIDHILDIASKMKTYIEFFNLTDEFIAQFGSIPTKEFLKQYIENDSSIKYCKEIASDVEKAEADKYPEHIENWKKGGTTRFFSDITRRMISKDKVIHIRRKFGSVELLGSGAEYDPSRIFPKYGNFYDAVMKNGGCEGDTGFKMFGMEVTKVTADKIYLGDKIIMASDIINKK